MIYDHKGIELKWQKRWSDEEIFRADVKEDREKFYCLEMFPYPSGKIHMGHIRNYAIGDVIARYKLMKGCNVLHPMGWDAFGLPAENAAINSNIHPLKWTSDNINHMKEQLKKLGISYDWSKELTTYEPSYYMWEQKIFVEMYNKGLVYRKRTNVNWCPECLTVLANEQVEDGKCWRCSSEVQVQEQYNWFFKITSYAEELLNDIDKLKNWPPRVIAMQKNWIGRSIGTEITFKIKESNEKLEVFTTRPDTICGVTFMSLAPEHQLAKKLIAGTEHERDGQHFINSILKEDKKVRIAADKNKRGFFTGKYAINPITGYEVPIFLANFVLLEYGTGAVMGVPAHDQRDFEFASSMGLEIKLVIKPVDEELNDPLDRAFVGSGYLVNSNQFNDMDNKTAISKIIEFFENNRSGKKTVNYKLRDWCISRQRYWGTPIPIVYCENCGAVPVSEKDLPVILPLNVKITGLGNPLKRSDAFINTLCPSCGGIARRETDTMDTFVESSWYFLRFCSGNYDKAPFKKEDVNYWMPVDQYIGGIEHAIMHLLYSRFYTKVLRDLNYLDFDEPFTSLLTQGMVCKETIKCPVHGWLFPEEVKDNKCIKCSADVKIGRIEKMSKSKKNVVDPDDIIDNYGADTARVFVLFAAPPEKDLEWSKKGIEGAYRFLSRVWRLIIKNINLFVEDVEQDEIKSVFSKEILYHQHSAIKKVTEDIERFQLNTALAAIMEYTNSLYLLNDKLSNGADRKLFVDSLETLLKLITPFSPHIAEELWRLTKHSDYLSMKKWPEYIQDFIKKEETILVVQVNGKVRSQLNIPRNTAKLEAMTMARENVKIQKYIKEKTIIKEIYVPNKLVNFVIK